MELHPCKNLTGHCWVTSQWVQTWLCKDHILFCRNLVIESAGLAAEMAAPKDLARWGSLPFGLQHP